MITGHSRKKEIENSYRIGTLHRTLTELEIYTELLRNWNSTQNSYRIGTLHRTLTELELYTELLQNWNSEVLKVTR